MNEFKRKQRLKKIIYSRAAVALLVVVALLLAHAVWNVFSKYRASIAAEKELDAELANVNAERDYLASSTEALQSQSGIEYELKEKFGAVFPGEKEIVIVNTATSNASDTSGNQGFFGNIWNWLSNF